MKKSLVLTGMMGVGKSTIGRLLAKNLNTKFIDVDKLIERKERKSVKKIFQFNGEAYFRKIEEKITLKLLKNNKSVIALGGGAFINNTIRKEVLKNSCSIWLNVKIETLIKRYRKNNRRPLIKAQSLEKDVKKIYFSRKKIYAYANYKLNCDNIEKNKIVVDALKLYEKNCN